MILLVFITGGFYIIVIASFFYGWKKLGSFNFPQEFPKVYVSIIIPMRNEEHKIIDLLNSLMNQDYPEVNYEIILVDDHSSDRSLELACDFTASNLKVLSLPSGLCGKKAALNFGIHNSIGDLIMTTDADCTIGTKWVRSVASCFQKLKPVLIMGPVIPVRDSASFWKTIWVQILSLELFSLLGSTAGSASLGHPVMCNGANMAFPRTVFPRIGSIYQNSDVPSGDDIFVMLALKKMYPGKVCFIKSMDAAVFTDFSKNIASFFSQRGRWVAKAKFYRDPAIILTAIVVGCTNVTLATTLIVGLWNHDLIFFIFLLIIKSLVDFPFLYSVTSFFGQRRLIIWFPLVQSVYFFYVCMTILVAIFVPVNWKGRKI